MTSQNKKYQLFQIVKSIPIVEMIAKVICVNPAKVSGDDYWYLSFIRSEEKIPSLKVNARKNVWFDYGLGIGGNGYDLLCHYLKTKNIETISKVLQGHFNDYFLFDQPIKAFHKDQVKEPPKNEIIKISSINHPALINYVTGREINLDLANRYCRELTYKSKDKEYFAIGFKNNSGYELRNKLFKGCTAKDITYLDNGASECTVFEGFFSWLSLLELNPNIEKNYNHLILNSINNFSKSEPILGLQGSLILYLDNDEGGRRVVEKVKKTGIKYSDESILYQGYNDLNEYLISLREKRGKEGKSD